MKDNEVIRFILGFLNSEFAARSMSDVAVQQSYQPTDQGINILRAIYIHKIGASRYGYPGKKSVFNDQTGQFDTRESQWRTPTFQVDGLSIQDPADINSLTASDLVEETADILQSRTALRSFSEQNINIFRVSEIRPSYIVDDQARHEQSPSFDFQIGYQNLFTTHDLPIIGTKSNIYPV